MLGLHACICALDIMHMRGFDSQEDRNGVECMEKGECIL